MCGIFGVWHLDGSPVPPETIRRATTTLRHRGPDDEGYLFVDTAAGSCDEYGGRDTVPALRLPDIAQAGDRPHDLALGFRRLAIIDLSPSGHQPMGDADRRLWIVFNGEIYNYLELRAQLESLGHRFETATDTEVVLHAYAEWGPDCLERFNGMWAFAVWDGRRRCLFCARDRFGIKPFYYFHDGSRFIFGSEIKALLCDPHVPREPNPARVYDYLALRYLNRTAETLFKDIQQLPAASYMLVDGDGVRISRYWDLHPAAPRRSDQEWVAEFRATLQDAVRLRLRSDVPVGSCLSGGIDSSSIVCLVNQLLLSDGGLGVDTQIGDRQKTFSSVYDYPGIEEERFIEAVVAQTNVESHRVTPQAADLFAIAPRLIWHQGEPFGSTTIYSQWHVMELTRAAGVTVLLDGQGADEMLAGYSPYYSSFLADLIRTGRFAALWREWRSFPHHLGLRPRATLVAALRKVALHWSGRPRLRSAPIAPEWLNPALTDHYAPQPEGERHFPSILDEHLYNSLTRSSLPSLLHYEDHNSMAFSVEARVPFLDYRLVELSYRLPAHLRINRGTTKVVLRKAMRGIIPDLVRLRQDKLGFPTPGSWWFRDEVADEVEQILRSRRLRERGYVQPEAALTLLEQHKAGRVQADRALWRMVCFELWMRLFFDRDDPTAKP